MPNTTAIPEVTWGLAELVDEPLDVPLWADKIVALLDDPNRYRPKSGDVAALKEFYDPARIAGAYVAALI